jgi:hypothetical protein
MRGPAAQMLGEKPFDRVLHVDLVLWIQETVAFVLLDHVLALYSAIPERVDEVVGLRLHDANVKHSPGAASGKCIHG